MKPIEKKKYVLARNLNEKRKSTRYPFSPEAEAVDLRANTRVAGRLSDIASLGCYMDTICPFPAKATIALTINKDRQSLKVEAEVVYSQIGMGMGLQFTAAEPDQLRVLEKWIEELRGAANPDAVATKTEAKLDGMLALPHISVRDMDDELREVLSDLVSLLGRKNIMNEVEEKAILQRLSK
jgi:hypothetical protein